MDIGHHLTNNPSRTSAGAGYVAGRQTVRSVVQGIAMLGTLVVTFTGLTGCGSGTSALPQPSGHPLAVSGRAVGGQQPVSGATIQLYAESITATGSASRPLLTLPVITDLNGNFTITGDYACPTGDPDGPPLVYIVATRGNPGLQLGQSNPSLALMTALGDCTTLSASQFITINEVTTAAAVFSLAPYMTSYTSVADNYYYPPLYQAFTLANEYANSATGVAPGPELISTSSFPIATLYTLADVVAACVNSAGGTAGDGSPCGTLFANALPSSGGPPTDTIGALLNMANNPSVNVPAEYALMSPSAPFQPTQPQPPLSWTLPVKSITSIGVTQGGVYALGIGGTSQVFALGYYSDGSTADISSLVTWSSSDPTVATVNSSGEVTGVGGGSVYISATAGGISGQGYFGVNAFTSLTLSPSPGTVGTTHFLQYTLYGVTASGTQSAISGGFTSSNTNIATISQSGGLAQGINPGQVTITAGYLNLTTTAQLTVFDDSASPMLYPHITDFQVVACPTGTNYYATGACTYTFSVINLNPGEQYEIHDNVGSIECCFGGGAIHFYFTAPASTSTYVNYTTPSPVLPTSTTYGGGAVNDVPTPVLMDLEIFYPDILAEIGYTDNYYATFP